MSRCFHLGEWPDWWPPSSKKPPSGILVVFFHLKKSSTNIKDKNLQIFKKQEKRKKHQI